MRRVTRFLIASAWVWSLVLCLGILVLWAMGGRARMLVHSWHVGEASDSWYCFSYGGCVGAGWTGTAFVTAKTEADRVGHRIRHAQGIRETPRWVVERGRSGSWLARRGFVVDVHGDGG